MLRDGRFLVKAGNLIYDHEEKVYGLVIEARKLKNVCAIFDSLKVFYPSGLDTIEIQEDDESIEVINGD